jgi:hypothetical protein
MGMFNFLKNRWNRANAAHVLMLSFVLSNTIGGWIISPSIGLIIFGVCSGIYGYLLGRE